MIQRIFDATQSKFIYANSLFAKTKCHQNLRSVIRLSRQLDDDLLSNIYNVLLGLERCGLFFIIATTTPLPTTTEKPCRDTTDCSGYTKSGCRLSFMQKRCPQYCGLCPGKAQKTSGIDVNSLRLFDSPDLSAIKFCFCSYFFHNNKLTAFLT